MWPASGDPLGPQAADGSGVRRTRGGVDQREPAGALRSTTWSPSARRSSTSSESGRTIRRCSAGAAAGGASSGRGGSTRSIWGSSDRAARRFSNPTRAWTRTARRARMAAETTRSFEASTRSRGPGRPGRAGRRDDGRGRGGRLCERVPDAAWPPRPQDPHGGRASSGRPGRGRRPRARPGGGRDGAGRGSRGGRTPPAPAEPGRSAGGRRCPTTMDMPLSHVGRSAVSAMSHAAPAGSSVALAARTTCGSEGGSQTCSGSRTVGAAIEGRMRSNSGAGRHRSDDPAAWRARLLGAGRHGEEPQHQRDVQHARGARTRSPSRRSPAGRPRRRSRRRSRGQHRERTPRPTPPRPRRRPGARWSRRAAGTPPRRSRRRASAGRRRGRTGSSGRIRNGWTARHGWGAP